MTETKEFGAIYLCTAKGCGCVAGRTQKLYCNDHKTAESRKEVENEWKTLNETKQITQNA